MNIQIIGTNKARICAEHGGYETDGESDGTEAVAICQKLDFDIIIIDIIMTATAVTTTV